MRKALLVGAAVVLLACSDSQPTGVSGPRIHAVYVSPASHAFIVGETVQLHAHATVMDCDIEFCKEYGTSAEFTWHSSNPSVVTVSAGLVRAVGPGSASVTAETHGVQGIAVIRVGTAYVSLDRVGRGGHCALTSGGVPYCWGQLFFNSPEEGGGWNMPRRLAGNLKFAAVQSGAGEACGVTAAGQGYCWGETAQGDSSGNPALVPGGLTFTSLSPGANHVCGVAAGGVAYCWGLNGSGQLGIGSADWQPHPAPLPVVGGTAFATISAGSDHTCALTAAGIAYCWGDNFSGQLGDGTTADRAGPAPVQGAPVLTTIVAGFGHSCGLDAWGAAWCWGANYGGALGIGAIDSTAHPLPERVADGVTFVALDAAGGTCALTAAGQAYCWGNGVVSPAAVGGGLTFRSIGMGGWWYPSASGWSNEYAEEACGIATDGRGYCWNRWNDPWALAGPIEP